MSSFAIAAILLGIVLGIGASFLIASRRRKAETETQELSIIPPPGTPAPEPQPPASVHIIPPRQWPSLHPSILAALWRCGEIPPEIVPGLAAALLASGWEGKWLRYFAEEDIDPAAAVLTESAPFMFIEMGARAYLNRDEAQEEIAAYLVNEIAEGRLGALEGVSRVAELYDWNLASDSKFASLVGWAFEAERSSEEEQPEIRQSIEAVCRKLTTPLPEAPLASAPSAEEIWEI